MAETFALVLQFDENLKSEISDSLSILRDTGIHLRNTKPQMILIVTTNREKLNEVITQNIPQCITLQEEFPISLSIMVTIPSENNGLCLTPTHTLTLMEFHEQLCNELTVQGLEINPNYSHGLWNPCCQIAEFVPQDQVTNALSLSSELNLTLTGKVERIAMVQLRPFYREISSVPFLRSATGPGLLKMAESEPGPGVVKPVFTKVDQLFPLSSGLTLILKVVDTKIIVEQEVYAESLVGDETGMIVFKATVDQEPFMKEGATIILHNAKIEMFEGLMRLAVDDVGDIEVAEPEPEPEPEPTSISVKQDNNMSLIECENLCNALTNEGLEIDPNYLPGSLIPYCQLAEFVPQDQVDNALSLSSELNLPLTGEVERIEISSATASGPGLLKMAESKPAGPEVEKPVLKMAESKPAVPEVEEPVFAKVDQLRPQGPQFSGLTLIVKVVNTKPIYQRGRVPYGKKRPMTHAESLVGDETGMIVFEATVAQAPLMKGGTTLILHNAKTKIFEKSMRLVGDIEVAVPVSFSVEQDNNLSLIENEEVQVAVY